MLRLMGILKNKRVLACDECGTGFVRYLTRPISREFEEDLVARTRVRQMFPFNRLTTHLVIISQQTWIAMFQHIINTLCAGKYFLKRGCPLKNSSTWFLFHVNVSSGELSQETPMCLSESPPLKVGPDRQSMARNVPDIRTHSAPPNPIPEQQTVRRKCSKKDRGQHNIVESK